MKNCTLIRKKREKRKKTELNTSKGDQQFTVDGRRAEITVDLVLQARAKMADNSVNGLEGRVVSEMIKQCLLEKISIITRCFQECFMGLMEAPSSWKIVRLVFIRKPGAEPKNGVRSYRAIALTSVMSKWYASCFILCLEKEREPDNWMKITCGSNKWDKLPSTCR